VRVFLDTGLLAGAFGTRGLSADITRVVLTEHELITGEFVLTSLRTALRDRFGVSTALAGFVETFLRQHHEVVPIPDMPFRFGVPVVGNPFVLASALAGRADILVTGDKRLIESAGRLGRLDIVDPRAFWKILCAPR
jgi:hypothetical protein